MHTPLSVSKQIILCMIALASLGLISDAQTVLDFTSASGGCVSPSAYFTPNSISFVAIDNSSAQVCGPSAPAIPTGYFFIGPPVTNTPVSGDLLFSSPISQVTINTVAVDPVTSVPAWDVYAYASGNQVDFESEAALYPGGAVTVTVKGSGITDLHFDAFNHGGQTYNFPPIAQITFTTTTCQTTPVPPPIPGSAWYQLDSNWASQPYDHLSGPKTTIGDQGCALTALNYALNAKGENFDPFTLNALMDNFPGDYSPANGAQGGAVMMSTATLDVSGNSLLFLDKSVSGQAATQALDSYLCSANPLPVIVQVPGSTPPNMHYVVVTGKSGNTYSIVDPGHLHRNLLSAYSTFTVRGVVKSPSGPDPSELDFAVVDDATLLITGPDGSQTGFDPSTGHVLKGTAQSAYFVDDNSIDTDTETLAATSTTYSVQWSLPSDGTYTVQVNGIQLGAYELVVKAFDRNGTAQTVVSSPGVASVGSTSAFQIQYSSAPGSTATVSTIATFQSTLADIANSLALGLIDSAGIANALTSKIQAAQSAASAGQNQAAINILGAFDNQVNAQMGKHITGVAPQVLLADAASLIFQY